MKCKLSLSFLSLLIIPIVGLLPALRWSMVSDTQGYGVWGEFLFAITKSAGSFAPVTCLVVAVLYWIILKQLRLTIKVVGIVACSIVLMVGVKSIMKPIFQEERPFVAQILQAKNIQDSSKLPAVKEQELVKDYYLTHPNSKLPQWLMNYRISKANSYSFPSGHAIFASILAFLTVGLAELFRERKALLRLSVVMQIWAMLVLVSRLYFGMHYPWDEMASMTLSFGFSWWLFSFLHSRKSQLFG